MRTATIYNFLIEANIIAGIAILLMIPVRKFFRKYLGNRAICFAWLLVAIRLLCPLALPNPLINEIVTPYNYDQKHIRPIAGQIRVRVVDALNGAKDAAMHSAVRNEGIPYVEARERPEYLRLDSLEDSILTGRAAKAIMAVYLTGAVAAAGWFVLANVRFRRQLSKGRVEALSGELQEYYLAWCSAHRVRPLPVYFVDPLSSACLVGVIRPYIALPLAASVSQARQMLEHEMCHYKARDHICALVTLICCVIHWFNPLVWLAAAMSRMDRELKCDDNVTRGMDDEARRRYAGTLIQSVTRRALPGVPMLATGMSMTGRKLKTRVGSILQGGRRIKALALAFSIATCLLLVCAFGTAVYGEKIFYGNPYWTETDGRSDTLRRYLEARSWRNEAGDFAIQTKSDALASPQAIKTEEEAIARACEIWQLDALRVDMVKDEWQWDVTWYDGGCLGRVQYEVTATKGEETLKIQMAMDGTGAWNVCHESDPFFTEGILQKQDAVDSIGLSDREIAEIKQFALDFTEAVEPGESQFFLEPLLFYAYDPNSNRTYALIEAPYDEEISVSKSFTIEIAPELRLIDYYSGNG